MACESFQRDTRIAVTRWYRTVQNWVREGGALLRAVAPELFADSFGYLLCEAIKHPRMA